MKKVFVMLLISAMIGAFTAHAITPAVSPVYASEQKDDSQQPQNPQGDKKKDDGGHSGHH